MKIAALSHSSHPGGAETAFLNLVRNLVAAQHEVLALFPDTKGLVAQDVEKLGVKIGAFQRRSIAGNTSNALYNLSQSPPLALAGQLKNCQVELVISNTSTFLDGALAAAHNGIPHLFSIHEVAAGNPEDPQGGLAPGAMESWMSALSDHLIFCSEFARTAHRQFDGNPVASTVIAPYIEPALPSRSPTADLDGSCINLMFIGAPTPRKNPVFAIETLTALRLRGHNAYLNFFGGVRDQTGLLESLIRRRNVGPYVHFLGKVSDPYAYFSGKAINFVCAYPEPFGLTVPECLQRAIPVLAPNQGGPAGMVDAKHQYPFNDVSGSVHAIENIVDNYAESCTLALSNYEKIRHNYQPDVQTKVLQFAIDQAVQNYRIKSIPFELEADSYYQSIRPPCLSADNIAAAIAATSGIALQTIKESIATERNFIGTAVKNEVKQYGVIPYQPSSHMDDLYRTSTGFSLELSANFDDDARLKMAAFVILRLATERTRQGKKLRVLAVGDGIGSDSIRIAAAGFDVDYMDFEQSVTSKVALQMFQSFRAIANPRHGNISVVDRHSLVPQSYDAILSLEVIEHVPEPLGFLTFLRDHLRADGILFISDCFSGIRDYWPTHLLDNEKFAGLLPVLGALSGFQLNGYSRDPLCKPYVLVKSEAPVRELAAQVLGDSHTMGLMIREQTPLVWKVMRNSDKIKYIFKRASINLKGYHWRWKLKH